MNKLAQLMTEAGLSIYELAELLEKDVLEIALARHGVGYTHLTTILGIAEALNCDISDMYPQLSDLIDIFENETLSFEERRDILLSDEYKKAFMKAGIDPDPEKWYLLLSLKSGNERRFRISSIDLDDFKEQLESTHYNNRYFVFGADCRHVILRKDTLNEVKIRNRISYAPFSTAEDGDNITIISSLFPRPESIYALPDTPYEEDGLRPLAELINIAGSNSDLPTFIKTEDDDGDNYINIGNVELIEIPMGLTNPNLYLDGMQVNIDGESIPLEYMTPAGNA